jgi:predicted lipoprotein with Yx(FWY)xxD motif
MKGLHLSLIALVAAGFLVAGVTSGVASTSAKGAKVAVASSKLGRILVDGRGRTLYLFEKDKNGRSACSGACATFWPPLIASGQTLASAGAKGSLLGTTRRSDGRLQVTYRHHPLYTFFKDTKNGQTKGEGINIFGAEWYAVSATGAAAEQSPSSAMSGNAGGSSGGYGY